MSVTGILMILGLLCVLASLICGVIALFKECENKDAKKERECRTVSKNLVYAFVTLFVSGGAMIGAAVKIQKV